MQETTFTLPTRDGLTLHVYRWAPQGAARGAVQIQHGLAEHAKRYVRFARALTDAGYVVYAPDSRGSGVTAKGKYGEWGEAGWEGWVDDIGRLVARIRAEEPGLKLVLFGHSMGSFATQHYLLDHSADVDAAILSGSTDVETLVDAMTGDEPTDLSVFNDAFEPRTGYEWLSRDVDEVDAYVADQACGWSAPTPPGFETLKRASDTHQIAQVRSDLPILIVSGEADPVAGPEAAGPRMVDGRYRASGVQDVELKLYPEARHELLNETNRDEVTADILAFLDRTIR